MISKQPGGAPAYWDLDGVRAELRYAEAVIVEEIEIYETCNPSAITKVELVDEAGSSYEVWRGDAWVAPKESRIFRIRNTKVKTPPVNRVRLYLDCSKVEVGTKSMQWASRVPGFPKAPGLPRRRLPMIAP